MDDAKVAKQIEDLLHQALETELQGSILKFDASGFATLGFVRSIGVVVSSVVRYSQTALDGRNALRSLVGPSEPNGLVMGEIRIR